MDRLLSEFDFTSVVEAFPTVAAEDRAIESAMPWEDR
jgi:hypothetical protein